MKTARTVYLLAGHLTANGCKLTLIALKLRCCQEELRWCGTESDTTRMGSTLGRYVEHHETLPEVHESQSGTDTQPEY